MYYIVKKGAENATENDGGATDVGACNKWAAMSDKDQYEVVRVDLSGKVIERISPEQSLRLAARVAKAKQ
jgi:hypothetical protein